MKKEKNSKGKESSKSKSSKSLTEIEVEEKKLDRKCKNKKIKEEEKDDGSMKFGRRMFDDDINTFFENIQQAAGPQRAFEGLCAIQLFSMTGEPRMGTPYFPGKKVSCQILLDQKREHFVLISYDPHQKAVNLYDSLYKEGNRTLKHLPKTICYQICSAYGHLAKDGRLHVRLQTDFESQDDEWSCGYRCVGAILAMYQGLDPTEISYDLQTIYDFFMQVIKKDANGNYQKINWNDVMKIKIGRLIEREETFYQPQHLMVNQDGYGLRKPNKKEETEQEEQPQPDPVPSAKSASKTPTTKSMRSDSECGLSKERLRGGKENKESMIEPPEDPAYNFPLNIITKISSALSNTLFK